MKNSDIRFAIQQSGFKHWEVAEKIGISNSTFCVWLRKTLTPEKKKIVFEAIERLEEERAKEYERTRKKSK